MKVVIASKVIIASKVVIASKVDIASKIVIASKVVTACCNGRGHHNSFLRSVDLALVYTTRDSLLWSDLFAQWSTTLSSKVKLLEKEGHLPSKWVMIPSFMGIHSVIYDSG